LQTDISQLNKKLDDLSISSGKGELVPLLNSLSAGREISDVYLAPNADEMSGDSEGEEVPGFNINGMYLFNKLYILIYLNTILYILLKLHN